jgi:hypothetical protein
MILAGMVVLHQYFPITWNVLLDTEITNTYLPYVPRLQREKMVERCILIEAELITNPKLVFTFLKVAGIT